MASSWLGGTDLLFHPELAGEQNRLLLQQTQWFTRSTVLKMVTHDNAQLLALSGSRSPCRGKFGVVEEGALADLVLVEGNPGAPQSGRELRERDVIVSTRKPSPARKIITDLAMVCPVW